MSSIIGRPHRAATIRAGRPVRATLPFDVATGSVELAAVDHAPVEATEVLVAPLENSGPGRVVDLRLSKAVTTGRLLLRACHRYRRATARALDQHLDPYAIKAHSRPFPARTIYHPRASRRWTDGFPRR